jgi:non-homologous end joining protein Ku
VPLAAALEKSGRAGIAKYVMRERQHLAAVRGVGGQLLLSTLRFTAGGIARGLVGAALQNVVTSQG